MSSCNMASEDHLGQREDGDLVLRVVGQVLVQVGQAGRVAAQLVIHHPQLVPRSALPAGPHTRKLGFTRWHHLTSAGPFLSSSMGRGHGFWA